MEMQGEKTSKISCTLCKLTSVSVNFTLEISCTVCKNKKRSHTQLDSRKQVIAFQDRVITRNIKEAQHPLK